MNERILRIVVPALEELNETREEKIPTGNVLELGLYGKAGVFESMHLHAPCELPRSGGAEAGGRLRRGDRTGVGEGCVAAREPVQQRAQVIGFIEEELQLAGVQSQRIGWCDGELMMKILITGRRTGTWTRW